MRRLSLTAKLNDPVTIKRARQSQRSEALKSVSGSTLRGALAAHYLRSGGSPADKQFRQLFLDEQQCRFGPLDAGSRALSLTSNSCKRRPGFRGDGAAHGVVDQLWLRVAERLSSAHLPIEELAPWMWCSFTRPDGRQCKAGLKAFGGFWDDSGGEPQAVKGAESLVEAHVGIDRATATAAPSVFYTLQSVEGGSGEDSEPLLGTVYVADDAAEQALRGLIRDETQVYIGHAKTRGYGRVNLSLDRSPTPAESTQARHDRRGAWSRSLTEFLCSRPFACEKDEIESDFFFSLGFPNGAILVDRYLRYSIDPHDLISWLPPLPKLWETPAFSATDLGKLSAVTAVTRHDLVRGWNAAHGLPKADEWMVDRGAVYVYRFRGTEDELAELQLALDRLEEDGLGLRRNEGFGVVEVSDSFHQRFSRPQQVTQ